MLVTHLARMVIVSLLSFVTQIGQIYFLVLALNVFYAFFTPTDQATIPFITGQNDYPQAIALSSATFQLLDVLGPGVAGAVAAFIGARQVFLGIGEAFFLGGNVTKVIFFCARGGKPIALILEFRQNRKK